MFFSYHRAYASMIAKLVTPQMNAMLSCYRVGAEAIGSESMNLSVGSIKYVLKLSLSESCHECNNYYLAEIIA